MLRLGIFIVSMCHICIGITSLKLDLRTRNDRVLGRPYSLVGPEGGLPGIPVGEGAWDAGCILYAYIAYDVADYKIQTECAQPYLNVNLFGQERCFAKGCR